MKIFEQSYPALVDLTIYYITKIQIDFELAAFNSIKRCFSNTKISVCLFHFSQELWRNINILRLINLFINDHNLNESVEHISSLALVPLDTIDLCWNYILQEEQNLLKKQMSFLHMFIIIGFRMTGQYFKVQSVRNMLSLESEQIMRLKDLILN
ncbi:hypothetical protein DMUE_5672 [Dictyocoela muelleri]|nr:hypothetical protein DMUE_5672 [Dictyocoela muelleri]